MSANLAVVQTQNKGLAFQPNSMKEAMDMADILSRSNLVPKNYKGQSGDILVAMMLGTELRLNPIQSLQNIAVINGKPALWGDSMMALVKNHPKFDGILETFDEETMTAKCIVKRKGDEPCVQLFSMEDAKKANLAGKTGVWQQYPKRMLALRARGFALRNQFADALAGLISAEEAQDIPVDEQAQVVIEEVKKNEPVMYPQDKFDVNIEKWNKAIEAKKITKADMIAKVETAGLLSDEMKSQIIEG